MAYKPSRLQRKQWQVMEVLPPAKKAKTEGADDVKHNPPAVSSCNPVLQADDQVRAALLRLAQHIGHPKKFAKASPLLRELLVGGKLQEQHGRLLFEVLRLSMLDTDAADRPEVRREYMKLFSTASKFKELFTTKERQQLDVYGVWAVLRAQLHTDDSFSFNKVLGELKQQVVALAEADPEEDALLEQLRARQQDAGSSAVLHAEAQGAADAAQRVEPRTNPASAPELDPFGLDALLDAQEQVEKQQAQAQPKKRRSASTVWTAAECSAARRQALLDCMVSAKAQYAHAWARTGYDLMVEEVAAQHRDKFTPKQQQELFALRDFVQKQRAVRKMGPSAVERRRDTTAFDAARAEWSRATVSARGKVGTGDHRNEAWLG